MSSEQFHRTHIPDYQRLCALTRKVPELDPDEIMTVVLLRTVAEELVAQLHASLDRHGISEGRMRVMAHLLDREEPISHSDIASATGVTKGTITGLVDGLEREGLVRRGACGKDRRVSYVSITPKGEELMQAILPGHLGRLSELVGVVSPEDRAALRELLGRFRAGLLALTGEQEDA